MQGTGQVLELVFPAEFSPVSYNWNFLSSARADDGSMDALDRYFESPPSSPRRGASHPREQSDFDLTETSQQEGLFSYPLTNDLVSGRSSVSYASSVQSDDFWIAEVTTTDVAELPSNAAQDGAKTTDRKHRRREQNRKAQSNFRQKRKEEVRGLQREVEELGAQLAEFHKRGPTANLTICTQCRTFYPSSGPNKLHKQRLSTNSDFFS